MIREKALAVLDGLMMEVHNRLSRGLDKAAAEHIVSGLKSHGLTIEADWNTDMESARKYCEENKCEVQVAGGFYKSDSNAYLPDEGLPFESVAIAHFYSAGEAPFHWRGANDDAHDEYYWYAPTAWRPITPPQEVEG